jgi:hypothetical protein
LTGATPVLRRGYRSADDGEWIATSGLLIPAFELAIDRSPPS